MNIIQAIGLAIFIIGGIGFLTAAFRTGFLWGLGSLLIPPVAIVYLVLNWAEAKNSFLLQIVGVAVLVGGILA